jgi:D-alanyl-D-alanine carboxypeptidase (penicillin-binding protein 5/6)
MRILLRSLCVATVLISMLAGPVQAQQLPAVPEPPPVAMSSGILVDLGTGKVLWARNERVRQAPASLTKILTALVILERLNLDQKAIITPDARAAPGARTYAEQGWTFTVRELLWGMLLQSGNDAAIALAHRGSPDGTVEGFMKLANARAAQMGARDTHFRNPHGYDSPGHLTTARDLAIITAGAMREPVFAEMVASRSHRLTWGDGQPHTFFNHNKLLARYPGTVGVKTGFTSSAGHCLASAVTRDGTTLLAIVLKSPNHYGESTALYDWAFANLAGLRARSTDIIQPAGRAADLVLYPDAAQTDAQRQRAGLPFAEGLPLLALGFAMSMTMLIVFRESILNP